MFFDDDYVSEDDSFLKKGAKALKDAIFNTALGRCLIEVFRMSTAAVLIYMGLSFLGECLVFLVKVLKAAAGG